MREEVAEGSTVSLYKATKTVEIKRFFFQFFCKSLGCPKENLTINLYESLMMTSDLTQFYFF